MRQFVFIETGWLMRARAYGHFGLHRVLAKEGAMLLLRRHYDQPEMKDDPNIHVPENRTWPSRVAGL